MPASSGSCRGMKFASPGRLSTRTRPAAPPIWAFAALVVNAQMPRETSRIVPRTESGGSVPRVLGSEAGPHRCRSTGLPSVPTIVPTSTSLWSALVQASGTGKSSWKGMFFNVAGASLVVTLSEGAKTWLFETAATEIASGAVPGEPTEPRPQSSRSLPAAITGTTPAFETLRTASTSASLTGSACGPPPEKLITFIPSFTAASKAATICGVNAS